MSRVLFSYERDMPTVSITREVFEKIPSSYSIWVKFKYLLEITRRDLEKTDILILMRPNDVYSCFLAKAASESGVLVITFCDDDLLHLTTDPPPVPWRVKGLVKSLKCSDVFLSSSRYLQDNYKLYLKSRRIAHIDTVVRPEEIAIADKRSKKITSIVYAASSLHVELFNEFVRPIMPRLVEKYGSAIHFTFVGMNPNLSEEEGGKLSTCKTSMPLLEYRQYMSSGNFDIGLAPLRSDSFSKCKYFNKFLEYTISGICGIYSNTEPYTYVVRDGQNGFLADKNEWYEKICQAIDDIRLREECVENARQYIRVHHAEEGIIKKLIKDIPELVTYDVDRLPVKSFEQWKLKYYFFKALDYIYLSVIYVRQGGFKKFIDKVRVHFREGKAYKKQ